MIIKQIKAGRAWLDWSQSDLAEKVGCGQSTITRLETGIPKWASKKLLVQICLVLSNHGICFIDNGILFNESKIDVK